MSCSRRSRFPIRATERVLRGSPWELGRPLEKVFVPTERDIERENDLKPQETSAALKDALPPAGNAYTLPLFVTRVRRSILNIVGNA